MPSFLSRASQQYAARVSPYAVNATIPVGLAKPVRGVQVTVSHPAGEPWPEGPVAEVSLTGPNRSQAFKFSGGQESFRGELRDYRSAKWEIEEGESFLAGSYTMAFKVLQTVTAAVLIEYFQ